MYLLRVSGNFEGMNQKDRSKASPKAKVRKGKKRSSGEILDKEKALCKAQIQKNTISAL